MSGLAAVGMLIKFSNTQELSVCSPERVSQQTSGLFAPDDTLEEGGKVSVTCPWHCRKFVGCGEEISVNCRKV